MPALDRAWLVILVMAVQDFRTGYLTMTSAKAMFISQLAGALMGCILAPATFFMIYHAFPDIGRPGRRTKVRHLR